MPALNLSVEHGTTLEDAKKHLRTVVSQVQSRFSSFVEQVVWSADATAVKLTGPKVSVDMRVDARQVHVTGDVSGIGGMIGSMLGPGLKGMIQNAFQKRLS